MRKLLLKEEQQAQPARHWLSAMKTHQELSSSHIKRG
jgi:hypothetical protein